MKKVLIASPVKGGMSPTYTKTLLGIILSKINSIKGGAEAKYAFEWAVTSGTSVANARDELAHLAIKSGFDKLVFWDVDLGAFESGITVSMLDRLLSHNVPVVAAQYVGHNFNSQFHGAVSEGAQLRPDGLLEMAQIPLGFSVIDVKEALLKIKEAHPHRQYAIKQTNDVVSKGGMFEFFPHGIVGPCSPEGKLQRLKEYIENPGIGPGGDVDYSGLKEILDDDRYDQTFMLGEDFYFCKLAREAGIPLYIDNNIIIPHESHVRLPVPNSKLVKSLTEQWRWADNVDAKKMMELAEQVQAALGQDHVPAA